MSCDSLLVTHPFHPLVGQRLAILFERQCGGGRLYVCEGGPLGTVGLREDATDRGRPAAEHRLSLQALAELAGVVAALQRRPTGDL